MSFVVKMWGTRSITPADEHVPNTPTPAALRFAATME